MYADNLIKKWDFEQPESMDFREIAYQEALEKISNLEHELKIMQWHVNQLSFSKDYYEKRCEALIQNISNL